MTHSYVNEFQASMNEHRNAQYKAVPPFVVEAERLSRLSSADRGYLRVWRRPHDAPRLDRWTKVYANTGRWDEIQSEYHDIADNDDVNDRAESFHDSTTNDSTTL